MQKTFLITGTNKGIGLALAKVALKYDQKVIAVSRSIDNLTALKNDYPDTLYIYKGDINRKNTLDSIVEILNLNELKVDVLVNNAGYLINKPFAEYDLKEAEDILHTNFLSPAFLIQALFPFYHQGSHIINISSMGGVQGSSKFPGLSFYSSAKGALSILTECLAEEFKEKYIYCNALALGAVQTEMLNKAFPGYQAPLTPSQIADFIYDFGLNGMRYFNGKVLPVSTSTP